MNDDVRVKFFLDAGMTYDEAVAATVRSAQEQDYDGARLFAEVAKARLREKSEQADAQDSPTVEKLKRNQ